MIKPALRIETAKATMPDKSIKSMLWSLPKFIPGVCSLDFYRGMGSYLLIYRGWLKMQKTIKNIEKVMISIQKLIEIPSTTVENVRQIRLFLQNKPNFHHFSPENKDYAKKQTQFKAKTNPIGKRDKNEYNYL